MPAASLDLDLDAASAVSDSHRVGCFVPPEWSAIAGLMALAGLLARTSSRGWVGRGPRRPPSSGPAGRTEAEMSST